MSPAKDAEDENRSSICVTVVIANRYAFDTEVVVGRQIKQKAPSRRTSRCTARTRGGNESIRDDYLVELHEGDHFFARPSASRRTLDDVQEEVTR